MSRRKSNMLQIVRPAECYWQPPSRLPMDYLALAGAEQQRPRPSKLIASRESAKSPPESLARRLHSSKRCGIIEGRADDQWS